MFIEIEESPPQGLAIEREILPEALSPQQDVRVVGGVRLSGRLIPVEEGAVCYRGKMDTAIEILCVRCLEPFVMEIDSEMELLYLPQSQNVGSVGDDERELSDNDMDVAFYRDDRIDLNQMIWEQIYLALPMKPLCKQDCRGLCQHCGTNLNLSVCSCERETVDPRLASLKTLLKS